jgi:PAS domain-containing protein
MTEQTMEGSRMALPIRLSPGKRDAIRPSGAVALDAVFDALPHPVLVIDADNVIHTVNLATELFFESSAVILCGQRLSDQIALDNRYFR